MLIIIVAAVKTTVALQENPALFVIDLLKSRTRMKKDNGEFEEIDDFTNTKDYIVPRIKKKKWKRYTVKSIF